jgi:aryl-alcohol dehydrogenase-like predicted oxidoreductase
VVQPEVELWDGRRIPALGMGTWPLAGPFFAGDTALGYSSVPDTTARAVVARALDAGVRFFDTAAVYGAGRAEELLGRTLGDRDDVVVATKFGPIFDPVTKQVSGQSLEPGFPTRDLEASLRRLRRSRVDLYLLHINAAPLADARRLFDELDALVESGKIGAYGWSTDFPQNVAASASRPGFAAVEHTMNLFFEASALRREIDAANRISIVRSPLAMGLLGGELHAGQAIPADDVRSNTFDWMDYFKDGRVVPEYAARLEAVRELLGTGGRTPAQGALGWIWAKADRALPVPGFRSIQHADDTIAALEHGPLPAAVVTEIDALLAREPEGDPRER